MMISFFIFVCQYSITSIFFIREELPEHFALLLRIQEGENGEKKTDKMIEAEKLQQWY